LQETGWLGSQNSGLYISGRNIPALAVLVFLAGLTSKSLCCIGSWFCLKRFGIISKNRVIFI